MRKKIFVLTISAIFALSIFNCRTINQKPRDVSNVIFYDVLNPSAEVRANPLGFDENGNAIVNKAFILWVYELEREIIKLRKELKELKEKKN